MAQERHEDLISRIELVIISNDMGTRCYWIPAVRWKMEDMSFMQLYLKVGWARRYEYLLGWQPSK